jgi:hypothetical protein
MLAKYDRQPDETASAWAAFEIFRDLGTMRTMVEAQKVYGQQKAKKGKERQTNNGAFARWRKEYDWDVRVRAFDADREKLFREKLKEEDHDKFIADVTKLRDAIETQATTMIQVGLVATAITKAGILRLKAEVDRLPPGVKIPLKFIQALGELRKIDSLSIGILVEAANVLERAYGIRTFIDNALEDGD